MLLVFANPEESAQVSQAFEDMRPKWEFECVNDPATVASLLPRASFDAAVVDLLLPAGAGVELLQQLMELSPHTLRLGLTTGSERHSLQQVGAPVHQFLSKPCDPTVLRAVLARAFAAHNFVANDEFKKLVAGITSLPVLPRIYVELMQELTSAEPSLERAGQVVARDMGLSVKILQLVNSAFFGLGRQIGHPSEAAMFLGTETLKALALSLQVFSQFQHLKLTELSVENLWQHSWTTGVLAKRLCDLEETDRTLTDEAFVSGLLHDVGKLVLAANFPSSLEQNIRQSRHDNIPLWEQECRGWGASHAELGGYVLERWGLAPGVVEAVAFHHRPAQARQQSFCAVTAVHAANTLGRGPSNQCNTPHQPLDVDYLRSLGLADRVPGWKQFFSEASENR